VNVLDNTSSEEYITEYLSLMLFGWRLDSVFHLGPIRHKKRTAKFRASYRGHVYEVSVKRLEP